MYYLMYRSILYVEKHNINFFIHNLNILIINIVNKKTLNIREISYFFNSKY